MKYFIDFEATQYAEEIISVGCVNEKGETFYSLVSPIKSKITPFITNLTGITQNMVDEALSPDEVFELFYSWAFENCKDELPEFYCWGNADVDFIRHTFKRTTNFKARLAMGYLAGGLIDYSKKFSKYIKATTALKLINVYNALTGDEEEQTHNALDDAMLLKEIFHIVTNSPRVAILIACEEMIEPKTPTQQLKWNQLNLPKGTICLVEKKIAKEIFYTPEEAANYVIKTFCSDKENLVPEKIATRVVKAAKSGKPYCGKNWRMV